MSRKKLPLLILLLSVAFCCTAQVKSNKPTRKRIRQETAILKDYAAKSKEEKSKANLEVLKLWFGKPDSSVVFVPEFYYPEKPQRRFPKQTIELCSKHNPDNFKIRNVPYWSYAVVGKEGDSGFEEVILFDEATGKIAKRLLMKDLNPYTKEKEPLIERENYFMAEEMGWVEPENYERDNNKKLIKKYFGLYGPPQRMVTGGDYYGIKILEFVFDKMALTANNQIVNRWSTFILVDSTGKTIFRLDNQNISAFQHYLSRNQKYYAISFGKEVDMNAMGKKVMEDGLIVYNIQTGEIVYKYIHPKTKEETSWEGAHFEENMLVATITHPSDKKYMQDKILIDLYERQVYSKLFTRDEYKLLRNEWKTKYKTWKNTINYFDYKVSTF